MLHLLTHVFGQIMLLLLLMAAVHGFGAMLVTLLGVKFANGLERCVFAQALGFGVLSGITLTLGVLGLYYPPFAWAIVVIGATRTVMELRGLSGRHANLLHLRSTMDRAIAGLLVLIALLVLTYALLANGLTPPVSYDAVAFHLAIPKTYIAAHRIIYIPYIVYSNWPLGAEMLFTLTLLLGSEFLAQLTTWSFAVIIGMGLFAFGRKRLLPQASLLAPAVWFSIPMVASLTGTGLVEVPLTCYSFLAFYALWRWRETNARSWFAMSALLSGCAAATKLNGAAIAIIAAALGLLLELQAKRPRRAMRMFIGYGVTSLVVVLPWYLKSWMFTGDPLWPFLGSVLGWRDWDALGSEYLLSYIRTTNLAPTFRNWLLGLWYVTTKSPSFGAFDLGPYLLGLTPLAALRSAFRRRGRAVLGFLALASLGLYSVWFLLTHQTRFLMPITPLLALLAADGVAWLWGARHLLVRRALQLAFLGWLLATAWIINPQRRHEWSMGWSYLTGQLSRDAYLTSVYEDYPAFHYANKMLPADALVLLAPYEARGYYLDRSYIWANPIGQRFLRMEQFGDLTALVSELRRLGITHILVNARFVLTDILYWEHNAHLLDELLAAHGRLMFESAQSQLYGLYLDEPAAVAP